MSRVPGGAMPRRSGPPIFDAFPLMAQRRRGLWVLEDFAAGVSTAAAYQQGFLPQTNGAGSAADPRVASVRDYVGTGQLTLPAAAVASQYARFIQSGVLSMASLLGKTGFATRFSTPIVASAGDQYTLALGVQRVSAAGAQTDGVWWRYSDADTSLILVHATNSTETTDDSDVVVDADEDYTLWIVADEQAGRVDGYVGVGDAEMEKVASVTPATWQVANPVTANVQLYGGTARARSAQLDVIFDYVGYGRTNGPGVLT